MSENWRSRAQDAAANAAVPQMINPIQVADESASAVKPSEKNPHITTGNIRDAPIALPGSVIGTLFPSFGDPRVLGLLVEDNAPYRISHSIFEPAKRILHSFAPGCRRIDHEQHAIRFLGDETGPIG